MVTMESSSVLMSWTCLMSLHKDTTGFELIEKNKHTLPLNVVISLILDLVGVSSSKSSILSSEQLSLCSCRRLSWLPSFSLTVASTSRSKASIMAFFSHGCSAVKCILWLLQRTASLQPTWQNQRQWLQPFPYWPLGLCSFFFLWGRKAGVLFLIWKRFCVKKGMRLVVLIFLS